MMGSHGVIGCWSVRVRKTLLGRLLQDGQKDRKIRLHKATNSYSFNTRLSTSGISVGILYTYSMVNVLHNMA